MVGYISVGYPDSFPVLPVALRKGLSELGFVEGQNVVVERRFAEGHFERLPELAAELAKLHVNVIVNATGAASVVQTAAPGIPIVSVFGSDPVRSGLAASLNRPAGNVTGVVLFSNRGRSQGANHCDAHERGQS